MARKRKKRGATPEEAKRYLLYDFAREWANALPAKRLRLRKKAAWFRFVSREY